MERVPLRLAMRTNAEQSPRMSRELPEPEKLAAAKNRAEARIAEAMLKVRYRATMEKLKTDRPN